MEKQEKQNVFVTFYHPQKTPVSIDHLICSCLRNKNSIVQKVGLKTVRFVLPKLVLGILEVENTNAPGFKERHTQKPAYG